MSNGETGGDRLLEFHRAHFKSDPEGYVCTAQSYDPYGHIDGWYAYFFACHQQQFPQLYKELFGVESPPPDANLNHQDASPNANSSTSSDSDKNGEDSEKVERYSDGTVRTLTDEEIAYFRESEVKQLELEKEREELRKKQPKPIRPESVQETPPTWFSLPDRSNYQQLFGENENEGEIRQLENCVNARFKKKTKSVAGYYPSLPLND